MTTYEKYKAGMALYYRSTTEAEGIRLLEEAVSEGSAGAALTLGMHYYELHDYRLANVYFEFGASKDEKNCLFFLAQAYRTPGMGKEVDYVKAYELMVRASEMGFDVDDYNMSSSRKEAENEMKKRNSLLRKLFGRR